ncbi:MAG: DNA polymerase III subunit delta [Lachnospiraceae bacterium]|nr:DNA polymerase III subunit delta [Lachnospiraceae bacterium]
MQELRKHIKSKEFCRFYLIYGDEDYLVSSAKRMLIDALKDGGDEMNYAHFEGAMDSFDELLESASTLPFFADRRVILCEGTGLFKNASDLADMLEGMCDTTSLVFVEKEVDKRTKMYKFFNDHGFVCELKKPDPGELMRFAAGYLGKYSKKITQNDCSYLTEICGEDMYGLKNELDKLIAYLGDREVVTREDIDEICTASITNKIFVMTDAIASGNRDRAMALYFDLLRLREKPIGILYMIRKHFAKLLRIHEERRERKSDKEIAASLRISSWVLKKYYAQLRAYDYDTLVRHMEYATDVETDFKNGKIQEQIGVELMIVKFSAM